MTKKFLTIGSLALAMSLNAQIKNKNGVNVLPEEGEYAISIDASPFLTYAGSLLSNAGAVAPTWDFLNATNTIVGKRMMSANLAYRGILRIGFASTTDNAMLVDARDATVPTYPNLPKMVTDSRKLTENFISLGAGFEKRRGSTRLQGVYGADALVWMTGTKTSYSYGNALADTIPVNGATTHNFGTNLTLDTYGNTSRVLENKSGTIFGFGVRGFVGVEYFIAPKISLGAEFGWGVGFSTMGEGAITRESVNAADKAIGKQEIKVSKMNELILDVDRNAFGTGNGAIKLSFYF